MTGPTDQNNNGNKISGLQQWDYNNNNRPQQQDYNGSTIPGLQYQDYDNGLQQQDYNNGIKDETFQTFCKRLLQCLSLLWQTKPLFFHCCSVLEAKSIGQGIESLSLAVVTNWLKSGTTSHHALWGITSSVESGPPWSKDNPQSCKRLLS